MSAITSRPRIRTVVLPVSDTNCLVVGVERGVPVSCGADAHAQFMGALVSACERASVVAGFPSATVLRESEELVRVVATSPAGHALVSDIELAMNGEATMSTEIVGLHDGTCQGILDRFDLAVEEAGVRGSPPTRRFTGGVCQLAGARALASRLVPKRLEAPAPPVVSSAAKRAARATAASRRSRNGL